VRVTDADTAMRIGLRNQLDDLARERERIVNHLAYIDGAIQSTAARLRDAEATR
jgi:hypothetical protein